jgi:hypothetical protein
MRGLKNDKGASNLVNGYIINYNFCRKHQSIKKTLAQAAGIEVNGWKDLIDNSQRQKTVREIEAKQEIEVRVKA